jgi:hypothetical protein
MVRVCEVQQADLAAISLMGVRASTCPAKPIRRDELRALDID